MINIYAQSFMTATRNDTIRVHDVLPLAERHRHHWYNWRKTRNIDPKDL